MAFSEVGAAALKKKKKKNSVHSAHIFPASSLKMNLIGFMNNA